MFRMSTSVDPPTLDPITSTAVAGKQFASWAYSRLFKNSLADAPGDPAPRTHEGDAVETWEQASDTELLLHLRTDIHFDPREPTNGRQLTAEDVVYSWERFAEQSVYRTDLAQAQSETAPIESVEALDDHTVRIRTAYPYAPLIPMLSSYLHLWLVPTETESEFDPANTPRGSGAWIVESFEPGVSFSVRRNPGWYGTPRLDGFDVAIIKEQATLNSQFQSGELLVYGYPLHSTLDLPSMYTQLQGEVEYAVQDPGTRNPYLAFGHLPDSPFWDKRVRQAVSMLIDRDVMTEVFNDIGGFADAGLPTNPQISSILSPGWGPYWLDPRGDDFGPNAQYYEYNPTEARRLLEAAGYPDGLDSQLTFITTSEYGGDFPERAEALIGMLAPGGVRLERNIVQYQPEWRSEWYAGRGQIEGMIPLPAGPRADVGFWIHATVSSRNITSPVIEDLDTELDDMIDRQMSILNTDERIELIHDIQRHAAESMVVVPHSGVSDPVMLYWPRAGGIDLRSPGMNADAAELYPSWSVREPSS